MARNAFIDTVIFYSFLLLLVLQLLSTVVCIANVSSTNFGEPSTRASLPSTTTTTSASKSSNNFDSIASSSSEKSVDDDDYRVYTDQFVLEISGGPEEAQRFADMHNFVFLGPVFGDHYHLRHKKLSKRSLQPHDDQLWDESLNFTVSDSSWNEA